MKRRSLSVLCLVFISSYGTLSQEGNARLEDSMCEKIVSESIPTNVQRKVSVSVRSTYKCGFLWLKTCSRYHTTYRMTTAIEYKVETRKITVCCNGTDATGNCSIPKMSCEIPGKFGVNCASDCNCVTNRTLANICDDVTGYCFCKDGYEGPSCDVLIPANDTDISLSGNRKLEVIGGGDIVTRVVVALVVIVLVLVVVFAVFCCWRRRIRRKAMTSGAALTDDIVVNILPDTESSAQYVTPEEIRRRKRQEPEDSVDGSGSKPYDYVEMRGLSGSRPALSDPGDKPTLTITTSGASISRKALEEDIAAGRISCAYANLPDQYAGHDPNTSHYYLEDAEDHRKLPFAPTYSFPRRQESKDSAFDDDGYCTSPTQTPDVEDLSRNSSEYAKPMYIDDRSTNQQDNTEEPVENIYDLPNERIHLPPKAPVSDGYANSTFVLQRGADSHGPVVNGTDSPDEYDRLERDC